jgi:hypothetical protein
MGGVGGGEEDVGAPAEVELAQQAHRAAAAAAPAAHSVCSRIQNVPHKTAAGNSRPMRLELRRWLREGCIRQGDAEDGAVARSRPRPRPAVAARASDPASSLWPEADARD